MTSRTQELREQVMARQGSFGRDLNPLLRDVARWRAAIEGTAESIDQM
jgi:hypothetical protein